MPTVENKSTSTELIEVDTEGPLRAALAASKIRMLQAVDEMEALRAAQAQKGADAEKKMEEMHAAQAGESDAVINGLQEELAAIKQEHSSAMAAQAQDAELIHRGNWAARRLQTALAQHGKQILIRGLATWHIGMRQGRITSDVVTRRPPGCDASTLTEDRASELQELLASLQEAYAKSCRKVEAIENRADKASEMGCDRCVSDVLHIAGELCELGTTLQSMEQSLQAAGRLSRSIRLSGLTVKPDHDKKASPMRQTNCIQHVLKGRRPPPPAKKTVHFMMIDASADSEGTVQQGSIAPSTRVYQGGTVATA